MHFNIKVNVALIKGQRGAVTVDGPIQSFKASLAARGILLALYIIKRPMFESSSSY